MKHAGVKLPKTPYRIGTLEFQDPVLLSVLLYILLMHDYSGFMRLSLLAGVGHESGHILVYYLQQKHWPRIRVSATGLTMKTQGAGLSQEQLALLAIAGPAMNFILAGLCLLWLEVRFRLYLAAFLSANILLGLFNLLPIPPLDGAVILRFLTQSWREKLHFRRK